MGLPNLVDKASEEMGEHIQKARQGCIKSNLPNLDETVHVYCPVLFNRETVIEVWVGRGATGDT